jgi:glycosyltransferase involved in cell wall biosynthesis
MNTSNKVILVSAYAVNPYKGSEDGMGWNGIMQIARNYKVVAFTRVNNKGAIEKYQWENLELGYLFKNIQFEYFDYPYWFRFWKKGPILSLIYFYFWQVALPFVIRKRKIKFDIAHNLNFHSDWTPSFLWTLGKPFVWGPIAHHPKIPFQFLKKYGLKAILTDRLLWIMKLFFWNLDPFLHLTRIKANKILAVNSQAAASVGSLNKSKVSIVPSVATEEVENVNIKNKDKFIVLSVGRFVPLKGFDITVNAFAEFYNRLTPAEQQKTELILVGSGPKKTYIESLIIKNNIQNATKMISWIDREKLSDIYRSASVFLFPSHEGAGMVVSEAMSYGLPVLCFDNAGPGEFVPFNTELKVKYADYKTCIREFAWDLNTLFGIPSFYETESNMALEQHYENFRWELRGNSYNQFYQEILSVYEKENSLSAFA